MDPLVIPIVAILMPLVLVPTILVMKYRHQRRKWEHLERLKAMETAECRSRLGQASRGPAGVTAIGAGVPAVSVLGAFLTTLLWDSPGGYRFRDRSGVAWICAVMISSLAMVHQLEAGFHEP